MKMLSAATVAALMMAGAASAQAPAAAPPAPAVPEALALEAAQTAISTCTANGYKVGVTVMDSAMGVRLVLGMDGVRQMGIDSSGKKAFTALSLTAPTAKIEAQAKTDAALQAKIAADPRLFPHAGAVLIMMGGKTVGAIGVGGAPGGEKDEVCALAGVAKIADRLK
jgi:uncharacterized protein GlcG (DUF336 family)